MQGADFVLSLGGEDGRGKLFAATTDNDMDNGAILLPVQDSTAGQGMIFEDGEKPNNRRVRHAEGI